MRLAGARYSAFLSGGGWDRPGDLFAGVGYSRRPGTVVPGYSAFLFGGRWESKVRRGMSGSLGGHGWDSTVRGFLLEDSRGRWRWYGGRFGHPSRPGGVWRMNGNC